MNLKPKFHEFPQLLMGTNDDGTTYFDATHYITCRGNSEKHSIEDFKSKFCFWINAVCQVYDTTLDNLFTKSSQGNVLIEESLSLLFVAYLDPVFGIYMLDRISEMLLNGLALSDTALTTILMQRLSQEDIQQIIKNEGKQV